MRWTLPFLALCMAVLLAANFVLGQDGLSKVELSILEKKTGNPVPCRIHLKDKAGKPQRAGALEFWHDHFVCPGTARLEILPGDYTL